MLRKQKKLKVVRTSWVFAETVTYVCRLHTRAQFYYSNSYITATLSTNDLAIILLWVFLQHFILHMYEILYSIFLLGDTYLLILFCVCYKGRSQTNYITQICTQEKAACHETDCIKANICIDVITAIEACTTCTCGICELPDSL